MTTISATSILASEHAITGKRIDTMLLTYPRWIHAEPRTHRVLDILEDMEIEVRTPSLMDDDNLSRNASSSRATPVAKLIQDVLDNPAVPLFWGANQRGMQAGAECNAPVKVLIPCQPSGGSDYPGWSNMDFEADQPVYLEEHDGAREGAWLCARDMAVRMARAFDAAGYHKQIVNRLLEPFSHIRVVVTATEWSNFFALRDHEAAEPHIRLLAQRMREAMHGATVQVLQPGGWHLPFVEDEATDHWLDEYGGGQGAAGDLLKALQDSCLKDLIKLSVARCASTSYKTVDGFNMTMDRAVPLHDKLVAEVPMHASPAEHVAQADGWGSRYRAAAMNGANMPPDEAYDHPHQHGNFVGFRQYRKMLPGECQ